MTHTLHQSPRKGPLPHRSHGARTANGAPARGGSEQGGIRATPPGQASSSAASALAAVRRGAAHEREGVGGRATGQSAPMGRANGETVPGYPGNCKKLQGIRTRPARACWGIPAPNSSLNYAVFYVLFLVFRPAHARLGPPAGWACLLDDDLRRRYSGQFTRQDAVFFAPRPSTDATATTRPTASRFDRCPCAVLPLLHIMSYSRARVAAAAAVVTSRVTRNCIFRPALLILFLFSLAAASYFALAPICSLANS